MLTYFVPLLALWALMLAVVIIRGRREQARITLRRRMWAVLDHLREQQRRGGAGIARW